MWIETTTLNGQTLHLRADRIEAVAAQEFQGVPQADLYLIGRQEPLYVAEAADALQRRILVALTRG